MKRWIIGRSGKIIAEKERTSTGIEHWYICDPSNDTIRYDTRWSFIRAWLRLIGRL